MTSYNLPGIKLNHQKNIIENREKMVAGTENRTSMAYYNREERDWGRVCGTGDQENAREGTLQRTAKKEDDSNGDERRQH